MVEDRVPNLASSRAVSGLVILWLATKIQWLKWTTIVVYSGLVAAIKKTTSGFIFKLSLNLSG